MVNKQKIQLPLQTISLVVGFMVWVIISSLITQIKKDIPLTAGQLSIVAAVPVILGSVLRVPIGFYTNRFGARIIFIISFILLLFPVYYISKAHSFIDLVIGGLFIGIGGAVFSVGVTSLPKYYPKERHGFVNGIYGAGNVGTAISTFAAPVLAQNFGWARTVQFYLIILLIFAALHFILGDKNEPKVNASLTAQIKGVYKNQSLWLLSLFYFITFGSFVAFTVFLPTFLVNNFGLTPVNAGMRTAGFIVLATFMRPIGGLLADKFNPYIMLMYIFAGLTLGGILLSFSPTIKIYTVGCLAIATCAGLGNGVVFKLVPLYFSKQAGIVNGIVSMMGGLGGFFPPLLLAAVHNLTGHYAIGFMALSQLALVSLILVVWMYQQEKIGLEKKIIESVGEGMMVTDKDSIIRTVNPAFTRLTGFTPEEVIGKKPNTLQSGKHDKVFYDKMWKEISENGYWQGEIWNKRKNGKLYLEWLTISEIKNDAGQVMYYTGLFSDISQTDKSIS